MPSEKEDKNNQNLNHQQLFDMHCDPALKKLDNTCTKIFDVLEGNGKPGLKVQIKALEKDVEVLKKWRTWSISIATLIAAGVVIKLVWSISAYFVNLIKFNQ